MLDDSAAQRALRNCVAHLHIRDRDRDRAIERSEPFEFFNELLALSVIHSCAATHPPIPEMMSFPSRDLDWRELSRFAPVYFVLSVINLSLKIHLTKPWLDGTLAANHRALLAFDYTNNEQSRWLQFYVPDRLRTGSLLEDLPARLWNRPDVDCGQ
jgi:hypothetical protein